MGKLFPQMEHVWKPFFSIAGKIVDEFIGCSMSDERLGNACLLACLPVADGHGGFVIVPLGQQRLRGPHPRRSRPLTPNRSASPADIRQDAKLMSFPPGSRSLESLEMPFLARERRLWSCVARSYGVP